MIYAVECAGRVKIGFSSDPEIRFSKLKADTPFPPTLVGWWHGDRGTEAELHRKFADAHCHGEWFEKTPELEAHLETVEFRPVVPVKAEKPKLMAEKWSIVEEVATGLGVGREALRKWREREKVPGDWHIRLIKNSGGRLHMADFIETTSTHEAAE